MPLGFALRGSAMFLFLAVAGCSPYSPETLLLDYQNRLARTLDAKGSATSLPQSSWTKPRPEQQEVRTQSATVNSASKLFVERYGSYSNEANYQNVTDVLPLMSKSFAAQTRSELAGKTAPQGFFGVTTRVIAVDVISQDEASGTAEVLVSTQRVEEQGSAQNTFTLYQDMKLLLVKESGEWKIDSALWQPKK